MPLRGGFADDLYQGHRLSPTRDRRRVAINLIPDLYASSNGHLQTVVLPVGVRLYATPDIESRVVIRSRSGDTLTSKDYPTGRNDWGLGSTRRNGRGIGARIFSTTSSREQFEMLHGRSGLWRRTVTARQAQRLIGGSRSCPGTSRFRPRVANDHRSVRGDMDNTVTVAVQLYAASDKLPAAAN